MSEEDPIDEYPDGISHEPIGSHHAAYQRWADVSAAAVFGALAVLGACLGILYMLVMLVAMLVSGAW